MKTAAVIATTVLAFGSVARCQAPTTGRPITVTELNKRAVVGELGLPLGTATEIRAKIISGRNLRRKSYDSIYLLKVTHVAGRKLDSSPILGFSIPSFIRVDLARDSFELYALRTGNKTQSLDSAQIEAFEKGYVGKAVRLVVYEVGSFSGTPRNLPKDVPVWADHGFHFSTCLVILAERE